MHVACPRVVTCCASAVLPSIVGPSRNVAVATANLLHCWLAGRMRDHDARGHARSVRTACSDPEISTACRATARACPRVTISARRDAPRTRPLMPRARRPAYTPAHTHTYKQGTHASSHALVLQLPAHAQRHGDHREPPPRQPAHTPQRRDRLCRHAVFSLPPSEASRLSALWSCPVPTSLLPRPRPSRHIHGRRRRMPSVVEVSATPSTIRTRAALLIALLPSRR